MARPARRLATDPGSVTGETPRRARTLVGMANQEELSAAQVSEAWRRIYTRTDGLAKRGQIEHLWPVAAGSALREDDRRSDPWRVSHAASPALSAALDHLHTLSVLVVDARVLHTHAPFTLARGCLENAAAALWIVGPSKRADRITRGLRWYATDARDADQAIREARLERRRPLGERLRDLQDTATRNGCDPTAAVKQVSSTEVLRYVDALMTGRRLGALFPWRLCSGFAHGRPWAALGVLAREERPSAAEPGVVHLRQTSSLDRLLYPAGVGLDVLDLAISIYEQRATDHRQPES